MFFHFFNESLRVNECFKNIQNFNRKNKLLNCEYVFVDDGSTDKSWASIKEIAIKSKNIFGISFSKNYGKSQALHAGFEMAKGNYVFTLDADLQDSPYEIPLMHEILLKEIFIKWIH